MRRVVKQQLQRDLSSRPGRRATPNQSSRAHPWRPPRHHIPRAPRGSRGQFWVVRRGVAGGGADRGGSAGAEETESRGLQRRPAEDAAARAEEGWEG